MVSSWEPQRFKLLITKFPKLLTMGDINNLIFCTLPNSTKSLTLAYAIKIYVDHFDNERLRYGETYILVHKFISKL